MFSADHWFSQCVVLRGAWGWVLGVMWLTELVVVVRFALVVRPKAEDKALKAHFGQEWEEWATRVPYRIFPGIY